MAGTPSIGDILMLSQLAWKIGRAFTAGRKSAPPEFSEVETEINSLAKALKLLAETLFADADDSLLQRADKNTQTGVGRILTSCQRTVNDLDSLIDQYQVIKKHRTVGGFAIDRSWSDLVLTQYTTMMWTTEGGNIQDLRNMLQVHTSSITLTMQALQSKSLVQLESIVTPMAEKIDNIHRRSRSLSEQLNEVHRVVTQIAGRTPEIQAAQSPDGSRPSSTFKLDASLPNTPRTETAPTREYFPLRQSSKLPLPPRSPPPTKEPPQPPSQLRPTSPTEARPTSAASKNRISEFSVAGSSIRYSNSYASSDSTSNSGWQSPTLYTRNSAISRQPSTKSKRASALPYTPEIREPNLRPESATLSPLLPPPVMDFPEHGVEKAMSISKLSLHPPTQPEYVKLHRSSTTTSQKTQFEKQAFKNAAILCDVRGVLVEYSQKLSSDPMSHDVEMVEACSDCRIAVVRKREPAEDGKGIRIMTSIWVFSDDNTVRLQLKMADGEVYVPYSSYFSPTKVSVTVPCELKYHDITYGKRPMQTAKTTWINYVFEDAKGAASFQNELMGRTLLATYRTDKTMRVHEGFSGTFAYAEQMCALENLRIWEDDDTGAVIAMIHFSAQFRNGYLAFYINSASNPIRVKDDGGAEVKIKGLRVPLDKGPRKDSVVSGKESKGDDKKKWITGAKIEFASEPEKHDFIALVKEVQLSLMDLPELLGVN